MQLRLITDSSEMARLVAEQASAVIREALRHRREATIIVATGDLCFTGISENAHLAFNDPPANFEVDDPYLAVNLSAACRRQQSGVGWFATLDEVPRRAVSMSIRQIMRSDCLLLSAPEMRKAAAVRCALEGPVTPACPASIIQRHPDCTVFLDTAAANGLSRAPWMGSEA